MAGERREGMDDISLAIGELRAEAKASNVQRVELFKQVGDIGRCLCRGEIAAFTSD